MDKLISICWKRKVATDRTGRKNYSNNQPTVMEETYETSEK